MARRFKGLRTLLGLTAVLVLLAACSTQPARHSFEGHALADSWEAQYLEIWGDSGV